MARTRAIQNALARFGMQASPKQIVSALADFGIDVTEGLVRRVKVGILKETARVERQQVRIRKAQRPKVYRAKVPARRGHHS